MKAFPWRIGEKDIKMLKELVSTSPKILQQRYFPNSDSEEAEGAFNSWIQRIKIRNARCQWYINNINNITRQSKYVRKRLLVVENREFEEEANPEEEGL